MFGKPEDFQSTPSCSCLNNTVIPLCEEEPRYVPFKKHLLIILWSFISHMLNMLVQKKCVCKKKKNPTYFERKYAMEIKSFNSGASWPGIESQVYHIYL